MTGALPTIALAAASSIFLVLIAHRLRLPVVALLFVGGVLLGGSGVALIDPSRLGDALQPTVSLAVAVILFEGGLTLDMDGYRQAPRIIRRMLTLGVLITWLGAAAAAYFLFDLSIRLALTAGSLVIVTGPTVIGPMLRKLGVSPKLHHILHWEGVLIDAVGVFVAVLCFETLVAGDAAGSLLRFGLRILAGIGIGGISGLLLAHALDHDELEDRLANPLALATCIATFALADAVLHECGVLAVVVSGLVVGVRAPKRLAQLREFKEQLTELGVGVVFILLAAQLDLTAFVDEAPRLLAFAAIVMCVLRPLSIGLCARGGSLDSAERGFLAAIAPRGIIAASMASLFSLRLVAMGVAQAELLQLLTYSVIAVTVVVQSIVAPKIVDGLGVGAAPELLTPPV